MTAAASVVPDTRAPLVGREDELTGLAALWRANPLVTLVGAGGIGKTSLAAAVAAEASAKADATVAWVDFSGLSDNALMASHVAAALGVREEPGQPLVDRIMDAANVDGARRRVLLVLDTCEHLLAGCTLLLHQLLASRRTDTLHVLATSRQALGVAGEHVRLVPPLDEAPAMTLFVQRARSALRAFQLTDDNRDAVQRIVQRLDGVPLAIELAAARVRLLPPDQLARRLDDAFGVLTTRSEGVLPRHRTLRALIDWSYDLLSTEERLLFERLSVFAGGFTADAATAVAGAVPDLLDALVDKSLVVCVSLNGRHELRDAVRQYARDRLARDADGSVNDGRVSATRRRHARYFVEFAEQAATHMHAAGQLDWLAKLDVEHENLRLALQWSIESRETDSARRLCLALCDFWRLRGHLAEGRRWIEDAQALPGPDDARRARLLVWAAVLARMQGDHESFREGVIAGEALARTVDDRTALADALTHLGVDLRDTQDLEAARSKLDLAIELWRALGDSWGLSVALCVRSSIAHEFGDFDRSRSLRLEALVASRDAGDREGEARALMGLGELARIEDDLEAARAYYERCLALFRMLGDTWHCAALSHNLGWVFAEGGRMAEAHAAFEEGLEAFGRAGNRVGLALCLAGFARLLLERGDPETAAVSFAAASERFACAGVRPATADARSWQRTRDAIEAALGAEYYAQLFELGRQQEPAESAAWAQEKLRMSDESLRTSGTFPVPSAVSAPRSPGAGASVEVEPQPDLRVLALGPLQIYRGDLLLGAEAFGPGKNKPRELLLYLLCNPEGRSREQVGSAFWPESSPAQVKNRFHVTLHRLRKALDRPDWIVATGERYRLAPSLRVDFDVARFEREASQGLRSRQSSDERLERLAAAVNLYRCDFLDSEHVGEWYLEWRDRLQVLLLEVLAAQGDLLALERRWDEAIVAWRSILARDPLHEEAARRLMEGLIALGDRSQAAHVYHELTAHLERDLRIEPDAKTTALYRRLSGRERP
ncbi:MAG TPA: tetratricopeptide repeat protein [Gemmatimonadaceae bacterium]|nr:tetratricopeptide repeat protein [Gemmatimonadaceae bacterium]